jgi:hypothetical protein
MTIDEARKIYPNDSRLVNWPDTLPTEGSEYEPPDPLIDFEFKHPMGEAPKPVQKL